MTDDRHGEGVDAAEASADAAAEEPEEVGFGARLAAERERQGIDRAEVARALNLRVGVIAAIEEERFSDLPTLAFVRGYVRSYGRLLQLPEAEIEAALASWRDPTEDGRLPESPASVKVKPGLGRVWQGHAGIIMTLLSIAVALALVLLLLLIWPETGWQGLGGVAPADEAGDRVDEPAAAPGAATERPPPMAEDRDVVAEAVADAVAVVMADAIAEPAVAVDAAMAAPAVEVAATESAAATEMAAAETVAETGAALATVTRELDADGVLRVQAPGQDLLRLSFANDCWVEIRDASGRGVFSDLRRAGQQLEVRGEGPFNVLLGYAHGVELTYNGEAVAVAPHIRNDIASLVVGR